MGAPCCKEGGTQSGTSEKCLTRQQLVKVYPLLCDLEADFQRFADTKGLLDCNSLAELWIAGAERKVGALSEEEKSLIMLSSQKFHETADIDGSGKVNYIEFQTFMRGGFEERAELHQMRQKLQNAVKKNPAVLASLIKLFNALDKNGDGFVTQQEIQEAWEGPIAQKYPEFRANKKESVRQRSSAKHADAVQSPDRKLVTLGNIDITKLLDGGDVNGDGRIDLWEFIAYAMGRRKTPVELLLYDISDGMSKRVSWALLGRQFEAIYHSSVLVFGFEYWYGGCIFKTRPPCTQCFGPPLAKSVAAPLKPSTYIPDIMSVHLGYTMATAKELKKFLGTDLAKKYRKDNYDILTNNCNGFSNDVVGFLTGSMIPEEVLTLPELVMATNTAKFMRPLLNRWLGGFGAQGNDSDEGIGIEPAEDDEVATLSQKASAVHADAELVEGTFVVAEGLPGLANGEQIVCRVIKESLHRVSLSYFDPKTEEITTRTNLAKSVVKTRLKKEDLPTAPVPRPKAAASPSMGSCFPCGKK